MVSTIVDALKTPLAALLAGGFAVADLWHFHALDSSADIALLVGALGALGVTSAFGAGMARSGLRPPGP